MLKSVSRDWWKGAAGVTAILVAVTLVGCGGGDDNKSNGGQPTSAATAAATAKGDDGPVSNDLKLIGRNTLFDKSKLRAKAGEITITEDNQDGGIVHNVHVYKGKDAKGESMGMTELEAGPVVQTLKLNLQAGQYFYVCDVHPATMSGTLTVE